MILAAAILVSSFNTFAADDPNEKVLGAFSKTFRDAKEVSWTESKNSYEVSFKQNLVQSRINYDKEGNIIQTLRYYKEENLPLMVLSKVKSKYADKNIFGVTEMSSEEGTFFYITLEDDKNWVEIKSDVYGSLSVQKKFKKG